MVAADFVVHQATTAEDEALARRLFGDLSASLPQLNGVLWPVGEATAPMSGSASPLLSCRCLVVLHSPTLVECDACRQTLKVFRERIRWHHQTTPQDRSAAVVTVRWSLTGSLDEDTVDFAAPELTGDFGSAYRQHGLLHILRSQPASPRYGELVAALAEHVTRSVGLPLRQMNIEDVGYAVPEAVLTMTSDTSHEHASPSTDRPFGHDSPGKARVSIVVAAAGAADQPAERSQRVYYGAGPVDWRPFFPDDDIPAATMTEQALTASDYQATSYPLSEGPRVDPEPAESDRDVFVVLVDPWVALSGQRERLMSKDSRSRATRSVVVMSATDGETTERASYLRSELELAFGPYIAGPEVRTAKQMVDRVVGIVSRVYHGRLLASINPAAGPQDYVRTVSQRLAVRGESQPPPHWRRTEETS